MKLRDLFPGTAARWYAKQAALVDSQRLYDLATAKYQNRYPGLAGRGYSQDAVLEHAGTRPRDYARHLDENSDLAAGVLSTLVDQVAPVEPEPMVHVDGQPVTELNDTLAELWEVQRRYLDASGTLPWGEYKRLTARTWLRDGEGFVRRLRGPAKGIDHRGPLQLAYQLLEPDYCPLELTDEQQGLVQGVQVNRWGRPSAYRMFRRHPGGVSTFVIPQLIDQTRMVPADQILHLKLTKRFPSVRGVSVFGAVATRLLDLKHYEESERIAARVGASFAAVIKRQAPLGYQPRYAESGSRGFELEAGMIMDGLQPGEDVSTINPTRPNRELTAFRNAMLRAISLGVGASYSTIARDWSGTYSSQRQELLDSQPQYQRLRDYFVEAFLRPVWEDFVAMAAVQGAIDPGGLPFHRLAAASFGGVATPWIDPLRETQADALSVRSGFKSRLQVVRERGSSARVVDRELAAGGQLPASSSPAPPAEPEDETEETAADE